MKFQKSKARIIAILALLCIAVAVLSSCTSGIGPANPFDTDGGTTTQDTQTNNDTQAAGTDATASEGNGTVSTSAGIISMLSSLALPILLIVALYFIMIRPQRKRDKETAKMRNELQIGDEITTIGGIIGKVVQIKDQDQIIIETGADKNRIRIKRWAIQDKNTISD